MSRFILDATEVSAIRALLSELTSKYGSAEDEDFLKDVSVFAHELPRRLRRFLNDFKQLEPAPGVCVISGYPVDDAALGPTPAHWNARGAVSPALAEEMLFILCGSLLGDVFGWATQQGGSLVHEVLPIKDDEDEQMGTGSKQTIFWHNEEAFHPYRSDYVGLMCMRNPDRTPTTFASVDMLELDAEVTRKLFEPHYTITPDDTHTKENSWQVGGDSEALKVACRRIEEMLNNPQPQPVMFGDPRSPYLCLDPYYMPPPADGDALRAFDAFTREVDSKLTEVVLQPGDILFVDNYRAVHGRKSFVARYDGNDRWLKRVNVTRDLRKSRDSRETSSSRIIY
ncbi:MAG TPA: guanitoxin biosynthesis L-enduracididine beta-hydroxylase GntD [Pyrinomonadaceae bacterium]|jgi:Fe(II)/alpha-ketoglutarate-dependent arginine beta-hydroxylase|nr:guanitoxin biosynthesis L-enduracididine beta-hydroxylase GntD [Pyrinomonadaceae bacterium]